MSLDADRLFDLLPAVYRIRDVELAAPGQPGPLRALLAIITEQINVIEEGLDQHYDDLFVETAADYLVPYIGELVAAQGIGTLPGSRFTERGFVANTIAYRRRKGTAAVLEQLAFDITGWNASVVEYFERLATTQYLNHLRPQNLSFAHVGDAASFEAVDTPFDRVARTADVRRIESLRGRYNIPHIGIFLHRLGSFAATGSRAAALDARRYFFDVFGRSIPLYNKPVVELEITHLADPTNVPAPLTRRELNRNKAKYYGPGLSLDLQLDGAPVPIDDIIVCDLSDTPLGWAHVPVDKIAVDPELGRIAFPSASAPPVTVRASYHYGFGADMGGGEYERENSFFLEADPVTVPTDATTIQQAINQAAGSPAVVEVASHDTFVEALAVAAGTTNGRLIEVRAADDHRPVIVPTGDWILSGGNGAEITLNGFLIGGALRVPAIAGGQPNRLQVLRIRHCTLLPTARQALANLPADTGGPRLIVECPNVSVEIEDSIVGAIRAVDTATVSISNSIVDAGDPAATAYGGLADDAGAPLSIENTTVVGLVRTALMTLASNTIFLASATTGAPVRAERLQQGCVRFSYVPPGSKLPRLHRCQPASAADDARVRPVFTSLTCGAAGYGQLAPQTAGEIRLGADDGAEMGAFHDLFQPQRLAGLRASLNEYLRFGFEAGIFLAS